MSGILITALTAIYLTINGIGPFVLDTNENSIIILQIFIGVISITALVLSSTVHETKSAQATIKKFNETLEARIQERTNELNEQVATRRKAEHKLLVSNRSLRKANKELDNFVYRVSHDLRAPIASVLGLVNLARNESKPEILLQYFEMVGKSAGQQDLFIKDILDISRNARLEVDRKKIYFRKLIEDTLDQLKYYDKNKKPETNIQITGKANFYSDPSRLKVIFNNLISNSIRYSNGRDPIIDINIFVDDSFANISIRDNGIGIEKKHQKKVFDMFYRATDDNAGSGLGLYIVKESIDKLSGSVELDSEVGTGTMVTMKVPNLLNAHPEESVEDEI
jgi:signal transduction histidine kinase